MFKVERLTYAMATIEGWHTVGSIENKQGSRSYRHNNPGNLRKSPFEIRNIDNFSVFKTTEEGFFAFKWDITQKAKGNTSTGLNGDSTLRDLIFKWAPKEDGNNPEEYLKQVIKMTGFAESMQLKELI